MPPVQRPLPPISPLVDRRTLIRAGLFGLAAVPAAAHAQLFSSALGFTHNVASGEPGATSVLLWTRYVSRDGSPATVRFEVSDSLDFTQIISGGDVEASPAHDWCAKPVATGLKPDSWYYYRFIEPDGSLSPIGRTRTLPEGPAQRWRMAVFSCSNIGFGWFNAYAHAAASEEFDLVVHTGDYFYEYAPGTYPGESERVAGRLFAPDHEIVALADYRLRYASYRADPDLQRLHQLYPFITVPDDHESANDAWMDGADNHQPATEGSWDVRKRAAMQANREWLPVSDDPWAGYEIGDLATLFRLETRLTGRDKPFDFGDVIKGTTSPEEIQAKLTAFRDGAWRDPSRSLMGAVQESWLAKGMAASVAGGKRWQVLAQQTVMGTLMVPPRLAEALPKEASAFAKGRLANRTMLSALGLPFNMDAWDGYPAARERLLASAREANANLVVLTGDSHNAWASDLPGAGVEFAGQSVTSPGTEYWLREIPADEVARAAVEFNSDLKWADTSRRGYMAVELTRARATCEYRFMETIAQKSVQLGGTYRIGTDHGARALTN